MARLPRLAVAGEVHLVVLDGHGSRPVFADDQDRAAFLGLLREAAVRHGVAVHAYALLEHRVVLVATPQAAEALGRLVQAIGRRYVAAFNRRHGLRGTLWGGRFRSSVLEAGTLLLSAMVFVETLPTAHGLASEAVDWHWSSAAHHAGLRRDPLVVDHPLYWRIGNTPFDREQAHTVAIRSGPTDSGVDALADAANRPRVLGSNPFKQRVAQALGQPVGVRRRGRPRRNLPTD